MIEDFKMSNIHLVLLIGQYHVTKFLGSVMEDSAALPQTELRHGREHQLYRLLHHRTVRKSVLVHQLK